MPARGTVTKRKLNLPPLKPRCGRVMLGYEGVWGALLDDVVCGRPEGHSGMHRSVQSLDRARERNRLRWPATRKRRQAKREKMRAA